MNAIGIFAVGLFIIGWLGAMISFFAFKLRNMPPTVWSEPEWRRKFLIFIGFCALGPLAPLIGIFFGGWPT